MGLFRRSNEPTERESFLVAALASAGLTETQINEAFAAKADSFLKDLDKSEALAAVIRERDTASASLSALTAALTGSGFTIEQAKDADSLRAAVNSRIDAAAEQKAVELSAARGVKPVADVPKEQSEGGKTLTRAQFEALSHEDRNAFMRSGGKLTN